MISRKSEPFTMLALRDARMRGGRQEGEDKNLYMARVDQSRHVNGALVIDSRDVLNARR